MKIHTQWENEVTCTSENRGTKPTRNEKAQPTEQPTEADASVKKQVKAKTKSLSVTPGAMLSVVAPHAFVISWSCL